MSAQPLYVPHPERVATSNAWAFLHWLRATRRIDLDGWEALIAWSASDPAGFCGAVAEFAGLPENSRRSAVRAVAEVMLHADLRPDDRVLIAGGPPSPWALARGQGTEIILAAPPSAARLFAMAARERASVLIADAAALPDAAFQRTGERPDLSRLRCVIALGGPLAPEARLRIYTWLKADLLLLARAGDRMWGSALDPVRAHAGSPLRFFRSPGVASRA
jgi:hypothetical protein